LKSLINPSFNQKTAFNTIGIVYTHGTHFQIVFSRLLPSNPKARNFMLQVTPLTPAFRALVFSPVFHAGLSYAGGIIRQEREKFSTGMPVEEGLINAGYSNS
jgi:hypothetical protein